MDNTHESPAVKTFLTALRALEALAPKHATMEERAKIATTALTPSL